MKLLNWSYTKRYNIKARYDYCPFSSVIFRPINEYYFVYIINWSEKDPIVTREHLALMELLINRELGTEEHYLSRKSTIPADP
ncbi:hypothetical protein ACFSCX_02210 [Bacillus salitolerans]|uniref:Uncharacterized protein n=1 Tax=Bacillus salitolerans TaxID=1437434 RepID=A0ABW4LKY9_9BACI